MSLARVTTVAAVVVVALVAALVSYARPHQPVGRAGRCGVMSP